MTPIYEILAEAYEEEQAPPPRPLIETVLIIVACGLALAALLTIGVIWTGHCIASGIDPARFLPGFGG